MNARKAWLQVKYNSKDITADLQPHLLGWSYTDNLSGQADDLQITLEDAERKWIGPWFPEKGAVLTGVVYRQDWEKYGITNTLNIGQFEIDEVEASLPPCAVSIKGISVPESSSLRGEEKHQAWEKTKLSVIAADKASKAKLKLMYDVDDDPEYDRVEQTGETDLSFLMRLCSEAGLCMKVTGTQLVIVDEAKYEANAPIAILQPVDVSSFRGRSSTQGAYRSCRVEYHSPKGRRNIVYTYTPPNAPKTGRTLYVNQRVASVKEAERLAKKKLREANKDAMNVSLSLPGDTRFVAGITLSLSGFGAFDGKYIVTRAMHTQQGRYETGLELRRCLEGY
ncbi:late control protein [Brevibacillus composti]|uniref:Late control protein n=1 Tax=Brevibacillus composti TaxID=2796470 RepID=A0A7T5EN98_9BACL|nr:contractile injection system protein, VgrG/Pvc8 family [Brevibacillus composti]QQE75725.1 late control protein [Brevibacillus composti]QUO42751.1 late control protein [Brevibacillus composti]